MTNQIIVLFVVIIACMSYYYLISGRKANKPYVWGIYFLLFGFALLSFLLKIISRFQTPEIWDFTAFYLYGKVAASGYNFYLPESFQIVFNSTPLPFTDFKDFIEEVVDVGFHYPPPTILYFLPLGFLSYDTAFAVWISFNLLFAIGSIYMIYSMFFKQDKLAGLLLVSILFFVYSQVRSTIFYTQTNFILLFLLLMMKKYSDKSIAGVLLAIAVFTKPYMIIFGLYFLLTKKWKPIGYFLLSSILISTITLLLIGSETFFTYFTNNATQRLPAWVFKEGINQSLHAVLLRANLIALDKPIVYTIIVSFILGLALILLIRLKRHNNPDAIWSVLLLIGLLVYPGTLSYYGVLLLFIIFQFFNTPELRIDFRWNIPIIGLFYFLSSVSVFSAICFLLIIIILISLSPKIKSIKPIHQ